VLIALALLPLCACGTINSYAGGCPAPFSGVRTDHEYLSQLDTFLEDGLEWLRLGADLPLSAVADTLTLPVGVWAQQPPPQPVSPGCLWAVPRR
jgi:uncharacterized protein YceK